MIKSWAGFWIILKKEVLDNLRDRRTLTTMGVSIIIGPAILFGFLWFAEKTVKEETDLVTAHAIELPVIGSEYAPNLMNWLRQNNIEIIEAPDNPEQKILDGSHKVILVIKDDYVAAFNKSKAAPLRLIHDSSLGEFD
jgi:sodium transport system permease protein